MKRFTATERWGKTWFAELKPVLKCLWMYLCDNADNAGVWDSNFGLASFIIGEKVCESDLSAFGDRIEKLPNGKFWLTRFIEFQYGKLSVDCRPHLKIFESLNKNGIKYDDGQATVLPRAPKPHVSEGKRTAIKERDGGKCVYCGSPENLQPDHIVSRKRGGGDEIENLVTACAKCNKEKSDQPLEIFLQDNPEKQRVYDYLNTLCAKRQYPTKGRVQDKEEEEDTEKEGMESPERKPPPPDRAETIYSAYPKKTGRQEALKYIRAALKTVAWQVLLEKTMAYADAVGKWPAADRGFIPDPERWYRKGRWEDDPATWQRNDPATKVPEDGEKW